MVSFVETKTMKKITLLFLIFLSNIIFAQTSDVTKKIGSLVEVLQQNRIDPVKLDSVITEAYKLYDESTVIQQKTTIKSLISLAKDLKNISYSAKTIKTPFESLDRDIQKKYSYEYDKFKKAGFVSVKRSMNDNINIYITIKDDIARIRLITKYYGSGWLFFNKSIFIIDGNNYEYEAESTSREVRSAGNVFEKSDLAVNENMLNILKAIVNSKGVVEYRLSGEKYSDFKLSDKEKENIILILNIYNKITE